MESATKSWWFQDLFQLICRLPVFMAVKNWQLREQLWQKQLEINTSSFSPSKVDTVGRPRDVGTVKGSSMALMMRHGVRTWGAKSTFSGRTCWRFWDSHNGSWAGVIPTTKGSITVLCDPNTKTVLTGQVDANSLQICSWKTMENNCCKWAWNIILRKHVARTSLPLPASRIPHRILTLKVFLPCAVPCKGCYM